MFQRYLGDVDIDAATISETMSMHSENEDAAESMALTWRTFYNGMISGALRQPGMAVTRSDQRVNWCDECNDALRCWGVVDRARATAHRHCDGAPHSWGSCRLNAAAPAHAPPWLWPAAAARGALVAARGFHIGTAVAERRRRTLGSAPAASGRSGNSSSGGWSGHRERSPSARARRSRTARPGREEREN